MSGRLAVIGGNGFIGQEVVRRAVACGWQVLTLDPSAPRRPTGLPAGSEPEHAAVSITDAPALTRALTDFAPDAAVNLAAYGDGDDGLAGGAGSRPDRAVEVNVHGTVVLMQALHRAGCRALSWSSSSTVYGPANPGHGGAAVAEDAAVAPDLVYGATKVAAEQLTRVLAATYGIRAVAVRLPLIYGSGRWYGGSQEQLVRFAARITAGEPARLAAWTAVADWMHVDDAARCLLECASDPAATAPVYNATGHRSSLHELGTALVAAAGATATAAVDPVRGGGPDLPLMDTTRIRTDIGFVPRIASPAAGARRYVDASRPDPT